MFSETNRNKPDGGHGKSLLGRALVYTVGWKDHGDPTASSGLRALEPQGHVILAWWVGAGS